MNHFGNNSISTSSNSNKRSMRRKEESPGRSYRFLDIIEKKHSSIFSILDEQCTVLNTIGWPNAQINLLPLQQTQNAVKTLGMIDSNRTQRVSGLFLIQHYAGVVEDDSKSFLDKNKDELPKEAHGLFVAFVRCNICGTWKDTEWQERRGRNQRR